MEEFKRDDVAVMQANASLMTKQAEFSRNMDGLLTANELDYRLPPALSVVSKRTQIKHYFTKNTYRAGENAVAVLNSGDMFVYGKGSYISYGIRTIATASGLPSDAVAHLGCGSALNVIQRAVFSTAGGSEIERVEDLNVWAAMRDRYTNTQDWMDSIGSVMGYKPRYDELKSDASIGGVATGRVIVPGRPVYVTGDNDAAQSKFNIPLSKIFGAFNSERLMPGIGFVSGARIEIGLANLTEALVWAEAPVGVTYEIYDISITLDSYQLSDAITKVLNLQSAERSLEFVFNTFDTTNGSMAQGTSALNLDGKRAVSRAMWAFVKTRVSDDILDATKDSFASEKFLVRQYQFQIGGLFLPNSPLISTDLGAGVIDSSEMYQQALYVSDNLDKSHGCAVTFQDFRGVKRFAANLEEDNATLSVDSHGCMAVLLERSGVLAGSGLPLNGSRVLQCRAAYHTSNVARTISMFTGYTKLVRIFLDRAIVKE